MSVAAGSPLTPEQLAEVEVIGKLVVKTDSANAPLASGVLALVADVRYWKAMHDQQVHLKRELHERYESSRLECERARALLSDLVRLSAGIFSDEAGPGRMADFAHAIGAARGVLGDRTEEPK